MMPKHLHYQCDECGSYQTLYADNAYPTRTMPCNSCKLAYHATCGCVEYARKHTKHWLVEDTFKVSDLIQKESNDAPSAVQLPPEV